MHCLLSQMKIYLRILGYARPYNRFVIPFFIFSLLGAFFSVFQFTLLIPLLTVLFKNTSPELAAQYADIPSFSLSASYVKNIFYYYFYFIKGTYGSVYVLYFVTSIIVVTVILSNLFRYFAQLSVQSARTYLVKRVREAIFEKINYLQMGYFTKERKGDLIQRINGDVYEIEGAAASSLDIVFKEPYALIAFFAALFAISVKLTLFTLIIIPISGIIIAAVTRSLRQDAGAGQASLGQLLTLIDESLVGMRIVRSFNATRYILKRFSDENDFYRRMSLRIFNRRELAPAFSEVSGVMVVAGIMIYGGTMILSGNGELTAEEFIGFITIFSQVLRPVKSMVGALASIQRAQAAGERILAVIDTPIEIQDKENAVELHEFQSEIEFRNVGFQYGERPILQNINFNVRKGHTVALVGSSGGGKSTIADLIPRFYDVKEGCILIDGRDIRDYTQESLRQQMGIVTQESILFNDTIFNNIAFGKSDAREEDVIQAAKIANAHDFILQTEQGYYTNIGDRGGRLSGGQKQRISIARAVFKNPPILILDEATSALDTESERLVQEALSNLMKGRTTLVIAHRLSTIQEADEILVVQEGQIVERGHHQRLIELERGVYRHLAMRQQLA